MKYEILISLSIPWYIVLEEKETNQQSGWDARVPREVSKV